MLHLHLLAIWPRLMHLKRSSKSRLISKSMAQRFFYFSLLSCFPSVHILLSFVNYVYVCVMVIGQSMIGHCLGAAGGIEAIATIKAITTGWIHPTINQFVMSLILFFLLIHIPTKCNCASYMYLPKQNSTLICVGRILSLLWRSIQSPMWKSSMRSMLVRRNAPLLCFQVLKKRKFHFFCHLISCFWIRSLINELDRLRLRLHFHRTLITKIFLKPLLQVFPTLLGLEAITL